MASTGYRPQPVPQGSTQRYGYGQRDGARDRRYDPRAQGPNNSDFQPRQQVVNNGYPNSYDDRDYGIPQSNGEVYDRRAQQPYQQQPPRPSQETRRPQYPEGLNNSFQPGPDSYADERSALQQRQERSYQYDPRYRTNGQSPPQPRARSRPPPDTGRSRPPPLNLEGQTSQNGAGYGQQQLTPTVGEREMRPRTREGEPERILTKNKSPKTVAWDNPFGTFPTKKDQKSSKHSSLEQENPHDVVNDARRAKADPDDSATTQQYKHDLAVSHTSKPYAQPSPRGSLQDDPTKDPNMDKLIRAVVPSYKTGPPVEYDDYGRARLANRTEYHNPTTPQKLASAYNEFVPGPYGGAPQPTAIPQQADRDRAGPITHSRVPEPQARDIHRDRQVQNPRPTFKQSAAETFDESSYRGVPRIGHVPQKHTNWPVQENGYRGAPPMTAAQRPMPPNTFNREPSDGPRTNTKPGRPQIDTHSSQPSMPNFDLISMSPHEKTEDHLPIPGAFEQPVYEKPSYNAYSPVEDQVVQPPYQHEDDIVQSPHSGFAFDLPTDGYGAQGRGGRASQDEHSYNHGYGKPFPSTSMVPPRQDSYGALRSQAENQEPYPPRGASHGMMPPRSTSDNYERASRNEYQDYPQQQPGLSEGRRPHTSHGQRPFPGPSRDNRRQHTGQGTGPEFAVPPSMQRRARLGSNDPAYSQRPRLGSDDPSYYNPANMPPSKPQKTRMNSGDPSYYENASMPPRRINHNGSYGPGRQPQQDQSYGYDDRSYSMPNEPRRQRTYDQDMTRVRTYDQPYDQPYGQTFDQSYNRPPIQQRMPPVNPAGDQPYPQQPPQQSMRPDNPTMGLPERPKTANSAARPPPVRHYGETSVAGPSSSSRNSNPDALPAHPVPIRPGLMQNGNGSQPQSQRSLPPPQQPPQQASNPVSPPVTLDELDKLREYSRNHPKDHAIALQFAKKLVEASVVLAKIDANGDARQIAKNREKFVLEAHKVVKKLVSANYAEAMLYMGECYGNGSLGLAQDHGEAFKYYHQAAKAGHPEACFRTGVCCEVGHEKNGGTKKDVARAIQWYEKAASLGNGNGMFKLGMIALQGDLGKPKDRRKAIPWLKRAAELADRENPHAIHQLAAIYEQPEANDSIVKDERHALHLYQKCADLGYRQSQSKLGMIYEYALLGEARDARRSIWWHTQAAQQGQNESMLALCGWYLTGAEPHLQQNDAQCYAWADKAASTGLPKALYAIGHLTESGIGVAPNLEEAKKWYYRAAAKNWQPARDRLEDLKRGAPRAQKGKVSRSGKEKQGECVVM